MDKQPIKPKKAYNNTEFLNSKAARYIRFLCEYEETQQRFIEHGVENSIVMFGSARTLTPEVAKAQLLEAEKTLADSPQDVLLRAELLAAQGRVTMSDYYTSTRTLARRLTEWNLARPEGRAEFIVTSGGGPGIMEAANRGAHDAGGRSMGLGISLPFEQGVNRFVTPELAFEFHYFFTRKYWFLYVCEALIVCPGGFGTMDELFETLTLIQTGKINKKLPIVLFGKEYWDSVFNVDAMVKFGTISPRDVDLFLTTDSIDEAFDYVTSGLVSGAE
jgi:uncharacterized protein (TIGR00730 family)